MLKHIKKKTADYIQFEKEVLSKPEITSDFTESKWPNFKEVKNKNAFLFTETGEMFRAFFFNDNGNTCAIPLANPVLIYFNSAQANLSYIYSVRKQLMSLFRTNSHVPESSLKLFYDFFGASSNFVIALMTSLEAFVNQKIPTDYIYKGSKSGKTYNNEQIQRSISLYEKIINILNKIENKNFSKEYSAQQHRINNLKQLRDNIVHTKKGEAFLNYTELFKNSLQFRYDLTIEAVRDFINYYHPNLIEPCNCGLDF